MVYIKEYQDDFIAKVRNPMETVRWVLEAIRTLQQPYLSHFHYIEKETGIPQFRVEGNNIFFKETGMAGTNGKGHSMAQALASGLMESAERYSCFRHMSQPDHYRVFPLSEMLASGMDIRFLFSNYPPDLCESLDPWMDAFQTLNFRWYAGYDQDGGSCLLPLWAIYRYAMGTNGFAAGNSLEEAVIHGLCEVIERDCFARHLYHQLQAPLVPRDSVTSEPIQCLLEKFDRLGEKVEIRDFSLMYDLPVLALFRWREAGVVITVGVATDRDEALARAITENSQGDNAPENLIPTSWVESFLRSDTGQTRDYADIPNIASGDYRVEIANLKRVLRKADRRFYYCETTDRELEIPAAIVYMPGALAPLVQPDYHYHRKAFHLMVRQVQDLGNPGDLERVLEQAARFYEKTDMLFLVKKAELALRTQALDTARENLAQALKKIEKSTGTGPVLQAATTPLLLFYDCALTDVMSGDIPAAIRTVLQYESVFQSMATHFQQQLRSLFIEADPDSEDQFPFAKVDFLTIDSESVRLLNLLLVFIFEFRRHTPDSSADLIYEAYQEFINERPAVSEAYEAYQSCLEEGALAGALEFIDDIQARCSICHDFLSLDYQRAFIAYQLGEKEKAIQLLEAYSQRAAFDIPLLKQLLFIYREQGDIEQMLSCISRIRKLIPLENWAELI